MKRSDLAHLPTRFGDFSIIAYQESPQIEHLAIFTEPLSKNEEIINVRIHSECLTGDAIGSLKCDCRDQLIAALTYINEHGGLVIYLRQEGRGIGLFNKINAYALQDRGCDTLEANERLGFAGDLRRYDAANFILNDLNIKKIKLITNNPNKLNALNGVEVVERIALKIEPNSHNEGYLSVKKSKMGHLFE